MHEKGKEETLIVFNKRVDRNLLFFEQSYAID